MKILHIDTGEDMRGGQRQALLTMRVLRDAGHECTLLAREQSPLWSAAVETGLPAYRAGAREILTRSGGFDLVHAHDARAHTLATVSSRRPFVVSRRVAFPVKRSLPSRVKYKGAARYLAVSAFVAKELEAAGVERARIDIVYDAVEPTEPALPWSPEYPAVALASRDPQKGRDLVEQAAQISGVEVLYSDNLVRDLQRSSMFLYLTRAEGLGSAVLLAMQMGVPVIASAVGGLTEVFTDGVSGLYVNNEVEDIVRAMRKVLSHRRFAIGLMESARERIADAFTPDHLLRGTLACYERALG